MGELWCPFAQKNPAPKSLWGRYNDDGEPKGVLHTTESFGFKPSPSTYYGHNSYPHQTLVPDMKNQTATLWQHIPVDWAARALRSPSPGVSTNRDRVYQLEIAWQAHVAHTMPEWFLEHIRRTMRWAEDTLGIPSVAIDDFHFYPPELGHRLGKEPWRMTNGQYDSYSGWMSHQHVPNNTHGDTGKIPIRRLLRGAVVPTITEEVQPMMDKYEPELRWPARATFVETNRAGIVTVHNDVSALDGKGSKWHKGDLRDLKLAPGAHIVGIRTHGTVDEGYTLYAADGGTFRFE